MSKPGASFKMCALADAASVVWAATAGLVGGSMLGVWRAGSGTLLGVQMAKNSFLLAFPFFGEFDASAG